MKTLFVFMLLLGSASSFADASAQDEIQTGMKEHISNPTLICLDEELKVDDAIEEASELNMEILATNES